MTQPEHISTILRRVLAQLDQYPRTGRTTMAATPQRPTQLVSLTADAIEVLSCLNRWPVADSIKAIAETAFGKADHQTRGRVLAVLADEIKPAYGLICIDNSTAAPGERHLYCLPAETYERAQAYVGKYWAALEKE